MKNVKTRIHHLRNRYFNVSTHTILLVLFLISGVSFVQAQECTSQEGETLKFDIKYKYGLINMKGGTANFKITKDYYEGKITFRSELDFKTTSFFDKIYKMRDTLTSYASLPFLEPIYHKRSVNEGSSHFIEESKFLRFDTNGTDVHVKRIKKGEIVVDSIISTEYSGYDLLNILLHIRNLNYDNLCPGYEERMSTFIGRRKVDILIRYKGETNIEGSKNKKYKALKFNVDITHDVFTESSNAIEIWIGNDNNRLPLRMKAKLKIGAADANLTSYSNLKYPLTSIIEKK
ncbi:hypothetical protein M2138_002079 [Dysgonomonadaceae bacterium PH5-43]|nr:hypothetical protein [Dysgonomonadaceae bacterium PH5-43]